MFIDNSYSIYIVYTDKEIPDRSIQFTNYEIELIDGKNVFADNRLTGINSDEEAIESLLLSLKEVEKVLILKL